MLREVLTQHDFNKEMEEARAIMESTFEQLGVPNLSNMTQIEFNRKFITTAGDAALRKSYHPVYKGKIRLSTRYFATASEKNKLETVVHEACHIANKYLYYVDSDWRQFHYDYKAEKQTKGHGPGWISLMQRMKVPANRYHCENVTQFKTYYLYVCPTCNFEWKLTSNMGSRILNGTRGAMCKCKDSFKVSRMKKIDGSEAIYGKV